MRWLLASWCLLAGLTCYVSDVFMLKHATGHDRDRYLRVRAKLLTSIFLLLWPLLLANFALEAIRLIRSK